MENMDNFRERFEALQQQTEQLKHQTQTLEAHTHTVERRLRWWRGIACGVVMLALLSLALPSGKAADAPGRGMAERMATMEKKLAAMDFDDAANEVVITGANLRIVNGLGITDTTNGVGNLIVGYNESREGSMECRTAPTSCQDTRTGSHNIVVGQLHNFSSFGGLMAGRFNEISGQFASVSGGSFNTASGLDSSVSGGRLNTASAETATVSGGFRNTASGSGSSVSGGENNTASGDESSVSGGRNRTAPAPFNWAAGPFLADE
jgi:hypothetical protein